MVGLELTQQVSLKSGDLGIAALEADSNTHQAIAAGAEVSPVIDKLTLDLLVSVVEPVRESLKETIGVTGELVSRVICAEVVSLIFPY